MRSLGVDLASQPQTTAACTIQWAGGVAQVLGIQLGLTDVDLISLAEGTDVIGIDAPFGWPLPFVELVQEHHNGGRSEIEWSTERRDALRFRRTDVHVRSVLGRWPLSVSSDLIAIVAMRCAGLLDRLGVVDRSGAGRVVETYPALALVAWGFSSRGYKAGNAAGLTHLFQSVVQACPWLQLPPATAALCTRSDHAFDALIASLVARSAALGVTERPAEEDLERARAEGWIAVPRSGSLAQLAVGIAAADS